MWMWMRAAAVSCFKPGETIIETVSPVDIGDLIGKYAFGSVDKK